MATPSSTWIQFLEPNRKGRDFVVGDLHGCFTELLDLLAHAKFNPKRDRLISVGDLVDRGDQSKQCLELLRKPWFFCVRGNHEQMLLDHWDDPEANPAFDARWLGQLNTDEVSIHFDAISKLPHVLRVGTDTDAFFVLHAELWETDKQLTNSMIEQMMFKDASQAKAKALWSRHVISSHWRDSQDLFHAPDLHRIFCGHTIVQMPMIVEKAIYMDTGAFAPLLDPTGAHAEHFGLSLIEAKTLHHWFAPTCAQYRGTVVSMGPIHAHLAPSVPGFEWDPEAEESY